MHWCMVLKGITLPSLSNILNILETRQASFPRTLALVMEHRRPLTYLEKWRAVGELDPELKESECRLPRLSLSSAHQKMTASAL